MGRRHPVVLGLVAATVALAAAVGAGAVVAAIDDDDDDRPAPEVTLRFDQDDDESAVDDLIGGDVEGEAVSATFTLLDGGRASLADFAGRPVVLNFFASWCAPCIEEMPAFEAVHQELGDRVVFIGLNLQESVETAKRMVEETGVTYLIGRDPSGEIFQSLDAVNMPSTIFIGADGIVVESRPGAITGDDLRAKVERLL